MRSPPKAVSNLREVGSGILRSIKECRIELLACTATICWIVAHIQYTSSKSCRLNSAMKDPLCACFYSQFQIKNFALLFVLLAPSFKFSPVVVISLLFQSRKSALYFGLVSRPNWLELPLQTSRDNATWIASSVAPGRASLTHSIAHIQLRLEPVAAIFVSCPTPRLQTDPHRSAPAGLFVR